MTLKRDTMCKSIKELFTGWKPPYPEEKFNPLATIENVEVNLSIMGWMLDYGVPPEYQNFWYDHLVIQLDPDYEYPAGVWEENGKRHMRIQPGYLNSGVIAHEQAHNSYALLTEEEKISFSSAYHTLENNKLLTKLWKYNPYGLTNDIEAHAEIYRYLGGFMPEILKQFYTKLF